MNVDGWCWCSTPSGLAIDGTLQHNLPAGACGKLWPPGYGNVTIPFPDPNTEIQSSLKHISLL